MDPRDRFEIKRDYKLMTEFLHKELHCPSNLMLHYYEVKLEDHPGMRMRVCIPVSPWIDVDPMSQQLLEMVEAAALDLQRMQSVPRSLAFP